MSDKHVCVAIYRTSCQADEALSRLRIADFGMNHLSLVGRDTWGNAAGSYVTGKRLNYGGGLGPFWEKLWSILTGWGVFCFYVDGPMLVAGPLVRTIAIAQDDGFGVGNTNGFERGMLEIGIPKESITEYEKALLKNQILLFVSGTMAEMDRAFNILSETKSINHTLHHGAADFLSLNVIRDTGDTPDE